MNMKKKMFYKSNIVFGGIVAYAVVVFVICLSRIFDNSFWADECYSIGLIRMSFSEMIYETGKDVHPPLYYIILKLLSSILGEKGYVFHLVSVIPVGLALLFCIKKVYKRWGALAAGLFISLIFFLDNAILFSVEVRMYSWANFFVLISYYWIYEIIQNNRKRDWGYFWLFSMAAAYTHYYALIAVAFLYIMLIVYSIWRKKGLWKRVLCICVLAVLCYLPWLFALLSSFGRTADNWWVNEIPAFRYCIQYLFSSKLSLIYIVFLGIGLLSLIYNTYYKKNNHYEEAFFVLSGLSCIIGTIAVGEIVSIIWRPMFQTRYVYVVAGIAWLLLAVLMNEIKGRRVWFIGIFGITLFVGIPNYYNWLENDKEYKFSTQNVIEQTQDVNEGDVIITNSEHLEWTILKYYYPDCEIYLYDEERTIADVEWVFWNREIECERLNKIVEGYIGPYNYVYVYSVIDEESK